MRFLIAGFCSVLLLSSVASAQEKSPEQRALKHLQVGRQLFDRADFEPALIQFEQAYALTKSWKLLIYIGVAQNRAKRYCDAMASLQRYLKEGGDAVPAQQRASVEHELKTTYTLRADVAVSVDGPPGATITVDNKARGKAPLNQSLCLEVGKHTIRAALPGFVEAQKTLTVEPQGKHRVVLKLERQKGTLRIESSPPGARLWLGKESLGLAPQKRLLVPGEYRVRAELDGYLALEEKVLLEARGRTLRLPLVAKPPPPAPAWYTRWYWWTAIGATVTAAVVVGIVVAAQPHYDLPIEGDNRTER